VDEVEDLFANCKADREAGQKHLDEVCVVSRAEDAGDGAERFLVVDTRIGFDVIEGRGVHDRAIALAASTQLGLGDRVLHQPNR
jgi:hypothetical protein